MAGNWQEVTSDIGDNVLGLAVQDFRNVCPNSLGAHGKDPLTSESWRERLREVVDQGKPQVPGIDQRMFRLWRFSEEGQGGVEVGLISLALDRTLKRDGGGNALRNHWCISLGLSGACIFGEFAKKAEQIYLLVKCQLNTINSNGDYKFALIWHVRDADPAKELKDVMIDNVFLEMQKDNGVLLNPKPSEAPEEIAYNHFREHLDTAFVPPPLDGHKIRFVEIESLQ